MLPSDICHGFIRVALPSVALRSLRRRRAKEGQSGLAGRPLGGAERVV
jgi:hypothetical protein